MATKYLDNTGLAYFWGKIKSWVTGRGYITSSGSITGNAATATRLAGPKHSYTTAANAAKNWYRIANANTSQIDTTKPLHVQFMLTAYNTSVNKDYYQRWFVDCEVFGRGSGIRLFGNSSVPFQYVRVLYENTDAAVTDSNRPAIDIYLGYVIASASHIEIEEVNNSGWTFLADGQLATSTVPSGFEGRQVGVYGSGVQYASSCDYAGRTRLQRSNITANATLANNDTYRSKVLNCTNAITITVPSIDSDYAWFLIKNFNAASTNKNVTIHPSTTSVLIDDSNADIVLKPGEWVIIASKAANSYTLISDGRWKSQKADKATTLEGYGITDAKIANGTITLGSSSITPLTSHQALPTLSKTDSGSGNAVTAISVSNHAITVTKGSTFLTSHQSLSDLGIGNVKNYDQSKAIKSITRSGTTFTYTCLDDTTGTFTQQDNNTWTAMTGATSSANGSVGYINAAPPKDGYNTKFWRADGSWQVPYTHPTTSGNKHIPSGGSSGQFLKWSADGTAAWAADNNTTYTFAAGDSNGQIKVTPSGGSAQNVSVKGLKSAAYTESSAYAAASHGTHVTFPSSGTPANIGTASNGTASTVARSDHVHALPDSGVTAGTYNQVTVDAKGRVTAGNVKHSYTTAANAAKNWYRLANASTHQINANTPLHLQFFVRAQASAAGVGYWETWFVDLEVWGQNAGCRVFGNTGAPFSQICVRYENTAASVTSSTAPAVDIYLNYVLAGGTVLEIEEVYNSGWTFVADGALAVSTVPSGYETRGGIGVSANGVERSIYADYVPYLNRQISNITAAFTLADSYLYRSRTLNCTGTFTITIPSINSGYMWCVIKNKNASSGVITLHPSTTSVLIDTSNADITLQPGEYVCIHSAGANNYSLIADGRWKSQKANVSHSQASNTITAMTGYSKPSSTSAIAATDTLNQAIGKLEKAIDDADITNVVHLTGTETINGIKKFTSTMYNISSNPMYIARNTFLTKGTSVQSLYTSWLVLHCDSQATDTFTPEARIGGVHYTQETSDAIYTSLIQYSKDSGADEVYAALHVGYDANGNAFARAPSTSSSRSHGEDIVTRNWIPNDSRIVHTSGDETIGGSKYFSSAASANRFFYARHLGVKLGDTVSEDTTAAFCVLGSDGYRMAEVEYAYRTDGSVDVKLAARKNVSQSSDRVQIRVGYDANGNAYTYAPTPAVADDSSRIATTEWVRDATGNFACNAATATKLATARDINISDADGTNTGTKISFDGSGNGTIKLPSTIKASLTGNASTATKATQDASGNVITSTYAVDSGVVHNTGDESVSGVKTLGSELIRNGVFVKSNAAAGAVTILGGVNANSASGAKADIYGASNATYAGGIRLQPGKTGAYKQMILLPDGTATWNGQAIQTSSDERLKTPLSAVPDAVLDAWGDVQWGQFQFLEAVQEKGESARLHLGLIAQRVKVAFEAHGLDACAYGILCHDVREATEDEPAADLWTVRYAEALAMESAYQRRRADRLEARIAALEVLL